MRRERAAKTAPLMEVGEAGVSQIKNFENIRTKDTTRMKSFNFNELFKAKATNAAYLISIIGFALLIASENGFHQTITFSLAMVFIPSGVISVIIDCHLRNSFSSQLRDVLESVLSNRPTDSKNMVFLILVKNYLNLKLLLELSQPKILYGYFILGFQMR